MATLFGIDFRATIGAAMAGQLRPVTLHTASIAIASTGDTTAVSVDHPCEGVVSRWDARTAAAKGFTARVVKVLILQAGLPVAPSTDDAVTVDGARWRILEVSQDPGGATWTLAAVPATGGL